MSSSSGRRGIRPWHHLVAIVGDSWATRSKLDDGIKVRCLEAGIPVIVKSDGLHGGTTDRVLARFVSRIGMLRFLDSYYSNLQKHVVIAAGINDAVGHRGSKFYCSNMMQIARLAADHGFDPYIIELPDVDIGVLESSPPRTAGDVKRVVLRWFNDHGEKDIIRRYREALRERLPANVHLVNIDAFANRKTPEKFIDHIHLYPELFDSLGEVVADAILPGLSDEIRIRTPDRQQAES